jgi:secreted Zn-dependent insulinase-like peptidase
MAADMVHTQYHLKVSASQLPGAVSRLGAMLSAPLLMPDAAGREVENVHAEYSRNCNSDARKLLQLRRSLGRRPYSSFSTGSITTLRDDPAEAGTDVVAALRALWGRAYVAPATTVAVLGPQEPEALEAWVRAGFEAMPATPRGAPAGGSASGSGGGGGVAKGAEGAAAESASGRYGDLDVYGEEQAGTLLRVAPMRDLRSLELAWFVPAGALALGSSKPWRVAGHVLVRQQWGQGARAVRVCSNCPTALFGFNGRRSLARAMSHMHATVAALSNEHHNTAPFSLHRAMSRMAA